MLDIPFGLTSPQDLRQSWEPHMGPCLSLCLNPQFRHDIRSQQPLPDYTKKTFYIGPETQQGPPRFIYSRCPQIMLVWAQSTSRVHEDQLSLCLREEVQGWRQ